jgi:hypothetical protein
MMHAVEAATVAAAKSAAMVAHPATMKTHAAMEAAATMESAAAAVEAAASTMTAAATAADFGHKPIRGVFRRWRRARIDQRQRRSVLARQSRQHQRRRHGNSQRSNKPARGIRNPDHA